MSLALTKLQKEVRIYKVVSGYLIGDYIIRTTYRDNNTTSYKWKLEVSFCHYRYFTDEETSVIFEAKNYTRDTLQRRFKEWIEIQGLFLDMVEDRKYFSPNLHC